MDFKQFFEQQVEEDPTMSILRLKLKWQNHGHSVDIFDDSSLWCEHRPEIKAVLDEGKPIQLSGIRTQYEAVPEISR